MYCSSLTRGLLQCLHVSQESPAVLLCVLPALLCPCPPCAPQPRTQGKGLDGQQFPLMPHGVWMEDEEGAGVN